MRSFLVGALAVVSATSCKSTHAAAADDLLPRLEVPEAAVAIHIDGELDAREWRNATMSGAFRDGARPAAPFSEARFLWKGPYLYVGLYAADEDIRSDRDFFSVELETTDGLRTLRVPPRGAVTPFVKGLLFAQDMDEDNSVDDDRDTDEEWSVEPPVPLERLARTKSGGVRVRVSRCDVPKDQIEHCGAWAGVLVLRGLEPAQRAAE